MYFAGITKQEYSVLLQTLAQDDWTVEMLIKANQLAKNNLGVTLRRETGEATALNTWAEFNHWYRQQQIFKRALRRYLSIQGAEILYEEVGLRGH
jgi:hypothetical protein